MNINEVGPGQYDPKITKTKTTTFGKDERKSNMDTLGYFYPGPGNYET